MAFYTAYTPPDDEMGSDLSEALSRAVVMKDGFSFPAFIFTVFWLLSKKIWLGFMVFAAFYAALLLLQAKLGLSAPALVVSQFALGIFLGLEGHHLWGQKLMAKGWRLADVVEARNQDEAERRFFERALAWGVSADASRPVPPKLQPDAPQSPVYARPVGHQVIGMFPEGASR